MDNKKTAYQKQGCLDFLRGIMDFIVAYDLYENNSVDTLRYRYNIPDEWVNKYWWMAISLG